ncbi:MAG: RidA family protein [Pseudorhodoplanes sp.]|uniref:RidA family protein n=1 Tax=Pseudorhodoplanes sp. TaxID=1934341 RepID=UPI003D0FAAC4
MSGVVERRLSELGYILPKPRISPNPNRRMAVQVGNILHLSGHGPYQIDPDVKAKGRFGEDVTIEEGYEVSRAIALSMIATIKNELADLDRVQQVIRLIGMVNCTPSFTAIPPIIDGASDVFLKSFGPQAGCHTRMVTGMASLANGITVELCADFAIASP